MIKQNINTPMRFFAEELTASIENSLKQTSITGANSDASNIMDLRGTQILFQEVKDFLMTIEQSPDEYKTYKEIRANWEKKYSSLEKLIEQTISTKQQIFEKMVIEDNYGVNKKGLFFETDQGKSVVVSPLDLNAALLAVNNSVMDYLNSNIPTKKSLLS